MSIIVKNEAGREIEISVYGDHDDDIQISEANYVDDLEADVSEADIEYIESHYSNELYEAWFERKIIMSDFDSIGDY